MAVTYGGNTFVPTREGGRLGLVASNKSSVKRGDAVKTGSHLMDNFVPGYDDMVNAGFTPDFSDFSNSGVVWKNGNSYVPDISEIFSYVAEELKPLIAQLFAIQESNSAKSREFAEDLKNWQYNMFQEQNQFNLTEAAKNRDWQKMMSDTAHQREVKDLIKAGLNPVLSATGGNGAAVTSGASASTTMPSGAMGSVDTSASGSVVSLLASMLSAQTNLAGQAMSALTNSSIADRNNSMSQYIAELQSATNYRVAELTTSTSYQNALLSYLASKYGADSSRIASEYASEMAYASSLYSSDMSKYIAENYPNNLGAGLARTLPGLLGFDSWTEAGVVAGGWARRAWDNLADFLMDNRGYTQKQAEAEVHNRIAENFGNVISDKWNYGGRRKSSSDSSKFKK